jgi:hypothetical protein
MTKTAIDRKPQLDVVERGNLRKLEKIISDGVATFVEVGKALAEIRDKRLYRESHKTFDGYCRERWNFEKRRAYQLIEAAGVATNVSQTGQEDGQEVCTSGTQNAASEQPAVEPPKSERVARELAQAPPEQQAAILTEAREKAGGEPTAAQVRDAVEKRKPCPNCGSTRKDDDGDCADCMEPAAKSKPEPIKSILTAVKNEKIKATKSQLEALAGFDEEMQESLLQSILAGRQSVANSIEAGCPPDPTMEEIIKEKASEIEVFCRGLMKYVADGLAKLDDPWLDDLNRGDGAIQKFKAGCETLRSAKCVATCPKCDGQGCAKCHKTGRVTRYTLQQLT